MKKKLFCKEVYIDFVTPTIIKSNEQLKQDKKKSRILRKNYSYLFCTVQFQLNLHV